MRLFNLDWLFKGLQTIRSSVHYVQNRKSAKNVEIVAILFVKTVIFQIIPAPKLISHVGNVTKIDTD